MKERVGIEAVLEDHIGEGLFDPAYRVGSIKPRNARKRSKLFKMGEQGRLILDALRRG